MSTTYQPGKSRKPATALNLGASLADHVIVKVDIDATTHNPVLDDQAQMTLTVPKGKHILWLCTQPFKCWFDDPNMDRTVSRDAKSPEHASYPYAQEMKAKDFKFTGMPYEYHIDTDGGTLDPVIIIKPN